MLKHDNLATLSNVNYCKFSDVIQRKESRTTLKSSNGGKQKNGHNKHTPGNPIRIQPVCHIQF